jgi:hypothetical protein
MVENMMKKLSLTSISISLTTISTASVAQVMNADEDLLSEMYGKDQYSPYAGNTFPERPLWCRRL